MRHTSRMVLRSLSLFWLTAACSDDGSATPQKRDTVLLPVPGAAGSGTPTAGSPPVAAPRGGTSGSAAVPVAPMTTAGTPGGAVGGAAGSGMPNQGPAGNPAPPMGMPMGMPMTEPMPPPQGPRMPGMGTCLQGSGNYEADGPYRPARMDVTLPNGLGPYTIFYPSDMESDCKHPIVAWGNGTSVTGSATYAAYHTRAASWGIVTIAAHNSNAGSMKFLEGGLDYLLAQNKDSSSMFFGKLSERAGVGGHSQGGFAATTATAHPNVEAEVCVQGGGFAVPARVAFLCQTGVEDFVRGQCTAAYNGAAGPAFLLDHQMADHISTPTIGLTTSEAGREYVRTATAWYRCWLADDENACALFQGGSSAPVCQASMWATCSSRNL